MLFNTLPFALFLVTVGAIYWLVPWQGRYLVLLAASYVFYGWWDARFLGLIALSTVVDFHIAKLIHSAHSPSHRRWLLVASVATNLGILASFKYWNFFASSVARVLDTLGMVPSVPTMQVILPVGISFYTFQTMSYTIDVYRRHLQPETRFLRFALFVSFFPQLVAGPIERAGKLIPQLAAPAARFASVKWQEAFQLVGRGLFRKVVIADGIAPLVNEVFSKPDTYNGLTVALGLIGFSLQIYGDFAGYTDIARGVAKMFGVDLMVNFDAPYLARSVGDFWRRWHISLSTWLRDYLYIPLGGNRQGWLKTARNLLTTMLLGGLWHGAAWGFVVWGGLHGAYLVAERTFAKLTSRRPKLPAPFIFALVTLSWVPFRAESLTEALSIFRQLPTLDAPGIVSAPVAVGVLGLLTLFLDSWDRRGVVDPANLLVPMRRGMAYGGAALLAIMFASQSSIPFLYFQF